MRKVHYRVVLDVLTTEDDDANGVEAIECMQFWPADLIVSAFLGDSCIVDIQDIVTESVEVTDSRQIGGKQCIL